MNTKDERRNEIANELTAAIKRCVVASGHNMPLLQADQCPLMAIQGFDSLCGIEVTVDLQERLSIKLGDNIFVKANGTRATARTVTEIIEALMKAGK
jgi:hypothetical protein